MRYLLPFVIVALALLGVSSVYVVGEGHAAVLTRFGHVEATAVPPGLHFKLPLLADVAVYDTRAIIVQSEPADYKTRTGETMRIGYFVRWRVADPALYFKATGGDELQVSQQMEPVLVAALRAEVAAHDLAQVLAADRGAIDVALRASVAATLRGKLGIDILDAGIERVLPPDAALDAIYKRMSVQATTRAGTIRDAGAAAAAAIRVGGEAEQQRAIDTAELAAATVRGNGDAAAAAIYAQAAAKDADFFRYWSALQTWRRTFAGGGAVVVLDKGSPFVEAIDAGASDSPVSTPRKH